MRTFTEMIWINWRDITLWIILTYSTSRGRIAVTLRTNINLSNTENEMCTEMHQSLQIVEANIEAFYFTELFLLMNETSLFNISLVSCSYHVLGSAGCHLVCSLSPWGLFRLKLKRTLRLRTEHLWWHELAKVGFSSAASELTFSSKKWTYCRIETEMSFSTPYLKWHMCLSHFPISMNLIRGAYANETSAL